MVMIIRVLDKPKPLKLLSILHHHLLLSKTFTSTNPLILLLRNKFVNSFLKRLLLNQVKSWDTLLAFLQLSDPHPLLLPANNAYHLNTLLTLYPTIHPLLNILFRSMISSLKFRS